MTLIIVVQILTAMACYAIGVIVGRLSTKL